MIIPWLINLIGICVNVSFKSLNNHLKGKEKHTKVNGDMIYITIKMEPELKGKEICR